ncbi:DUF7344 domain-containing protein [Haloplanus salilacus]|uniref:DUF7344 domain-containing protein n=1 Tax=Haloplanus salilacus TaxID=2949994 RepID=UPI0030D4AEBB
MDGRHQSVDLDVQLRTLSAAERREVLHTLSAADADAGTTVDIGRFVDASDADPLLSMHHIHLPKLEETGLVRVDRDSNRVRRGPESDDIEPLLRLIDDHADELPVDWP